MPNKKKKKNRNRNRSVAAVYCAMCQNKLTETPKLLCVCTRVNFCNENCLSTAIQTGKHVCPGAPSNTNRMRQGTNGPSPLDDAHIRAEWQREYAETIQNPINQILLIQGMKGNLPAYPGPEYYGRLADEEDSGPCAYMAGILYKNRLLGAVGADGQGGIQSRARQEKGVLETEELAFKYLLQASKDGIGIAMQSLAELYIDGKGVRERRITGNNWLWEAVLLNSSGAHVSLDSKALLPLEIDSMVDMSGDVLMQLLPGQSFNPSGPHLTSLLASLMTNIRQHGFKLHPFAATKPTLMVGNEAHEGTTGEVPMIGANSLEKLCVLTEQMRRRGNGVNVIYGRRGIGKAATAQTYEESERRILDSFLYTVPPEPSCNDQFDENEVDAFCSVLNELRFLVHCVHSEGTGKAYYNCPQCIRLANDRLAAISHGSVALSLYETLPARGRTSYLERQRWQFTVGHLQSLLSGRGGADIGGISDL